MDGFNKLAIEGILSRLEKIYNNLDNVNHSDEKTCYWAIVEANRCNVRDLIKDIKEIKNNGR